MLKHELRKSYKEKRDSISPFFVSENSLKIANRLLDLSIWDFLYYHIFLSITEKKEVNTNPIITMLQGRDKNIIIPKMSDRRSLKNYLLTDSTLLKKNQWGVPEPVDGIEVDETKIDVVFLPLLAFDKTGNRVGYGKGFYDFFLHKCRPEVLKIGLSFFKAEESISDMNKNDIRLDYCVTPNEIYQF